MLDYLTSDNWVSLGGKPITDIRQRIQQRLDDNRFSFHVGTDSKSYLDHTIITTTICFRENTKGALVAYQRNKIDNFNNITERLLHETIVSLDAAKMVQEAEAYKAKVIADSEGEAERFSKLLVEYQKAPEVTRERLYIDAIESVYGNSNKVLMDSDGSGNLMYLPIDKLLQQNSTQKDNSVNTETQSNRSSSSTTTQDPRMRRVR